MWNLGIPSPFHVESRWNGEPKMSGIPPKTYSTWIPHRFHVECGGGSKDLSVMQLPDKQKKSKGEDNILVVSFKYGLDSLDNDDDNTPYQPYSHQMS
jgi:hypothetical protein